jgi:lipid-A-disaccharide synthase
MKYYIIAGERSGDMHAGNLVRSIKSHDAAAQFKGFGGDYMSSAGVQLTVHYRELAFMGIAEVLSNLNKISKLGKICKDDILAFHPDVVILVDYGGFNTRIAKFARKNNLRVYFYITPKVWAWHQRRALTLKANVDRMFVILPFEKDFYKKFDWDVDYVGNPVLDAVKQHQTDSTFLQRNGFIKNKPLIALLPGSRKQELMKIIPLMVACAEGLPDYQFAVATVDNLDTDLYGALKNLPNVKFIENDTYNLLKHATSAVVTSGTATLETALLKVPQVVVYVTSWLTYKLGRSFITVKYLSLVNLIADKPVVVELIQEEANTNRLIHEVKTITEDERKRTEILGDYDSIYKTLDIGSASENAGRLMYQYLVEEKAAVRQP